MARNKEITPEIERDKFTDHRGTIVREGDLVAYNLSGEVALGEVVSRSITNRAKRITVRMICPQPCYGRKEVSSVRYAKNLMVVNELRGRV